MVLRQYYLKKLYNYCVPITGQYQYKLIFCWADKYIISITCQIIHHTMAYKVSQAL